jgi:hypothetical protein
MGGAGVSGDRWFWYKRGYWEMAVNAINRKDANEHIKVSAPGAVFTGEHQLSVTTMATGMVTAKRQAQIHEAMLDMVDDWNAKKQAQEPK